MLGFKNGHTKIIKISDRETPIHAATQNGRTEIVKLLAPLTDNSNALGI